MTQISGVHNSPNGLMPVVVSDDYIVPYGDFANIDAIENRAKINMALKPMMGVERIMFNSITELSNEFGPNGESVFEIDSKDDRVRVVGGFYCNAANNRGGYLQSSNAGDYIEVCFYGTGINVLLTGTGTLPVDVIVDNGAEFTVADFVVSGVLDSRNYRQNRVTSLIKGLSPGFHTVKFKEDSVLLVSGIEILNESNQITVKSGKSISNNVAHTLLENESFNYDEVKTGVKGGRVIGYLAGGKLHKAWQPVDATVKYLTDTDHSNEEAFRPINFREFGANRSDDFSTLTTLSSRAFALEDDSTSLMAASFRVDAVNGPEGIRADVVNGKLFFSFIGTGLDIIESSLNGALSTSFEMKIDGVDIGFNVAEVGVQKFRRRSIVSGLPYGIHNFYFTNGASPVDGMIFKDFIVYGPKKPILPEGATEICDYNVMADYVRSLLVGPEELTMFPYSKGVLAKSLTRGSMYSGTWALQLTAESFAGFYKRVTVSGGSWQHAFFGDGFEIGASYGSAGTYKYWIIEVDGVPYTGDATVTGGTWDSVNSRFDITAAHAISITGLSLGSHTIKLTAHFDGTGLVLKHLSIITPIHINDSDFRTVRSLSDKRSHSPIPMENGEVDWSKAKALIVYNQANSEILFSKNISGVLEISTGHIIVYFEKRFKTAESYVAVGNIRTTDSILVGFRQVEAHKTNISSRDYNGNWQSQTVSAAFFGELADE